MEFLSISRDTTEADIKVRREISHGVCKKMLQMLFVRSEHSIVNSYKQITDLGSTLITSRIKEFDIQRECSNIVYVFLKWYLICDRKCAVD